MISDIPKKPLKALPRLIEFSKCGADARTAAPASEAQTVENFRCHIGSST